jgi:hypothetical protein
MVLVIERPSKAKAYVSPDKKNEAQVKIERIIVTPEIAAAFLDKNLSNRKVKRRNVDAMAKDMVKGRFSFTGDSIRFSHDGKLIDGQHRLLACVKAEKPFETLVIYDLDPAVQAKIDTNIVRSIGDTLAIDGFHNSATLASAARLLLAEREHGSTKHSAYSKSEVIEFIEYHKEMASVVNLVRSRKMPSGVSPVHISAIVYIGKHLLNVPKITDSFYDVMVSGVPAYKNCAAHAFRERMVRNLGNLTALSRDQAWRLAKHSWNAFSVAEEIKHLRMPKDARFSGLDYELL